MQAFVIDKCHHIDGQYNSRQKRRILCFLNWFHDVQTILKFRKHLPKGIYVSEDLPEEWVDRRRMLKPIFNAAKCSEKLKLKTFLTKDKLIIDGQTFTVAPVTNLLDAAKLVDLQGSYQHANEEKIVFLGCHSVFSNLYRASFTLDNVVYNCVEQRIQSLKAGLFNDDQLQAKILCEANPYKIKKLGSKVKNFNLDKWRKASKQIAYTAIAAKFTQNKALQDILLSTGSAKIAESSTDKFWGTGLHLHHQNAMDQRYWKGDGLVYELYTKLCHKPHSRGANTVPNTP